MQRGRVLNLSKYQVFSFLKDNAYSLVSIVFLVIGIVLGLILFDDFKIITYLSERFFDDFIALRQNSKYLKIVLFSYFRYLLIFLFMFISGTTLFGVITVPLSLSFFGFFYGTTVAYLYSSFALKGVAFNAVVYLPSSLILLIFVILAARYSMMFSLNIAKLTMPNSVGSDLFLKFKEYLVRFSVVTIGSFSAALIDGLTAVSMLKFFEF